MSAPSIVILVPHPSRSAVLTTADRALPTTTGSPGGSSTADQLAAVTERLGTLPPVLRIVLGEVDSSGESDRLLVDLETIGPIAPDGLTWTDDDALDLSVAPPDLLDAIRRSIARHRDGPGPLDPPQVRPGWMARASAWMTARMAALGHPATAAPRVAYLWGLAMVLRAESAAGPMYLKCSAPVFGREAEVTAKLAEVTPELVTRVADVQPDENWLLMYDHGEGRLGDGPPERWRAAIELLPTIQRAWTARTGELVRSGAVERPIAGLAGDLPGFAARDALAAQLSPDDRRAWDAALPGFVAACRRLDELGPAPTLVHGDFHPWNVTDEPTGPRIFDWTDAAISHPFTDLAVFVTRADDVSVRRALRDAYLARWSDDLEPEALAEAGDLALVVGTLYQVDSYLRIVESLGPDDIGDLAMATGSWARSAVATLTEGIDVVRPGHADG
jgi:hypothetical protein